MDNLLIINDISRISSGRRNGFPIAQSCMLRCDSPAGKRRVGTPSPLPPPCSATGMSPLVRPTWAVSKG